MYLVLGIPDSPVASNSSNVKPMDATTQKFTRDVPKALPTNVSSAALPSSVSTASSEFKAPSTPGKAPADASKSFPLQFGSISPGFMNGMQIPARTSSAPPNLDEQKKAQARHESLRSGPAMPIPSIPKQQLPKKDAGSLEQPNAGDAQLASKSKRDAQVSAPPPAVQAQKPSIHPSLVPVQFGGPNPQIQSQAMSGTSLPMPMPMSLPLGNPPVQHSMFVPGLQPHPLQSQGMMHQGQSLNFSPQMGPIPPQMGNMGMNMAPQFPPQPAVKYSGSRKTVKITHPETHEELRLESSPASRSHPNMPSQSQPIPSFPPNIPMNFYPSSYNAPSLFFPAASSVPLSSSQVPPTSQPPRFYNQVTVKPPSRGEKEQLPPTGSLSVGKEESSKPSRLRSEDSVRLNKDVDSSSLSSLPQTKPGLAKSYAFATSSAPVNVQKDEPVTSVSAVSPKDDSASASTTSADEAKTGAVPLDSIEDNHKNLGNRGQHDQVGRLSATVSSSPSQLAEAEVVEAKSASSGINMVSETAKESSAMVADSCEASHLSIGGAMEEKTEPQEIIGNLEEGSDVEVTSANGGLLEDPQEKPEESSGLISDEVEMNDDLSASTHTLGHENTENSGSVTGLSEQNEKTSPDVLSSVPNGIDARETTVAKYALVDQESAPVLVPSPPKAALGPGNDDTDSNSCALLSPSLSNVKDKALSDTNVARNAVPRVKKKRKELFKKAEAAGTSSDLYMAYKGPVENKEAVTSADGSEKSSIISEKQTSANVSQDNAAPCEKPAQGKVEPEDWEDAAEISSPQLETSKNENDDKDGDGYELATKSAHVSRQSYPSPGRTIDRTIGGSRPDRRGSGLGDEDKWSKFPGSLMSGRGDMRTDLGYASNIVGFRPGQGGNYGVLRNPRAQAPMQYAGGILSGPMQSMGPHGLQRNNSDSDRWQRGTGFQKGLMPSPQTPMPVMHKAEKKYEVGRVTDEEDAKQRQLKGILNKLTPQNFEKLFQQVKQLNIDNVGTLSRLISQIFDKALMEPTFCEMYANFCFHLAADLPDLSVENERITFKRLLLNKCQEEFERGEREEEEANKAEEEGEAKQTAEEREEKRLQARRRMLGNIRLIGELYKKRMLTERIMHECINKLLGQYQNPDEENIEALCKLMSTIGEMIDHPKAKEHIDAYFDIMAQLSNNMKLSSRVRFMLKDSIDLRKNKWQQRRKVEGPKKIEEVHRDAAQERQTQASRLGRAPSMASSVRRGPPMDFGPRSPGMLSPPGSQIGGFRAVPPQLRGYGSQDVRMDERHSFENRTMSVPLPQRPLGDDSITLGPQGGLAKGMAYRGQPSAPNVPLAEIPSPGDARRMGPGPNGFSSMPERAAYGQREDLMPRYMPDRFAAAPNYDHSHPLERNMSYGNREVRNTDSTFDRSMPTSPPARGGPTTSTQNVSSDKVWSEERFRDKSVAAIREFYSARDENEVALCIKDLNSPSFYPSMISIWVTDSFERKDVERDLLTKLLINLTKPRHGMISEDQLIKGFESVLAVLEDAVSDAPKAAEFLGRIFAKVVMENVISLSEIGRLIYEGGEEQGQLVEIGLAAEVLGSVLDIIKSEKGESVLNEIRSSSNLRLENFRPAGSNKSLRIDKFI
ncbi:UNVERIFIED_CONTAM: Eukaryotic translation initiation factor 4G [Sesamum angustifolium]|uniref:Eukaryotic translation initiation factor 4G n=1 Tax=Sesamum angustifolium TaxID=2727405 RepID=A0AAW2RKD9_9LAMI